MALHRSEDKMILGVCKGIAEEYNYDVSLVRILTVVLGLISAGTVLVVYIVLGVILPLGDDASSKEKKEEKKDDDDYSFSRVILWKRSTMED